MATNNNQSGYILILTFFMITLTIVLFTSIIQKALSYQRQIKFNIDKQKARTLAISSIDIAIEQVSFIEPKKEKIKNEKEEKKAEKELNEKKDLNKQWYSKIANIINKWQTINLNYQDFGLDAKIELYISCEDGKLDINYLAREVSALEKKKEEEKAKSINSEGKVEEINEAKKEEKSFISIISNLIEKNININIINAIKDVQKIIKRPLDDITDLFIDKKFKLISNNLFLSPEKNVNNKEIYLMDLFTVDLNFGKINPWVLSKSLSKILGLNTENINMQELIAKFKSSINWTKDWDNIFMPIYNKNFNSIDKEITNLFPNQFEINAFSVIINVSLDNITQRVYAIISLDKDSDNLNNKIFKIQKIYWF